MAYCILSSVLLPLVPHKAAAEVAKIRNLLEMLVVANHGWQSESTDGPKLIGAVFFGAVAMVAVVTSPTIAGVVACSWL